MILKEFFLISPAVISLGIYRLRFG